MKCKKKVLPNGLRVLFVPMLDNPTVTVLVLVGAGSEHEEPREHGIAHFLEHMCFKGTTLRPNSIDIARELEGLGAQSNAFTSRRYTGYYAKAQSKQAHKIFDVVADVFLNPTFPEKELEKEKGVVIEEINMYEDMPQYQVEDVFNKLLYGDSPAGRTIVGTKETVGSFTQADLTAFRDKCYHAENTIVVVAGSFDEKAMMQDIEQAFGSVASGKRAKLLKQNLSPEAKHITNKEKKSEQTHIVLGVPGLSSLHKDEPVLKVLAGILGGGMSSRLFQKLREEMGVCYYIYASANTYTTYGDFTIHAGVPEGRVAEVLTAIKDECITMAKELVGKEELTTVQNYMTGSLMLGLESSDDLATYYGMQEAGGIPLQMPQERAKQLRQVSAEDVRRVAKFLFKQDKFRLALVGPGQDIESLEASMLS